jgi:hypothetical protein
MANVFQVNSTSMAFYSYQQIKGMYSSSFTTLALDGGEWSVSRPGHALAPEKGPLVPIGQEAGWAPELVWTQRLEEKYSCLCWGSNLNRPVIQSIVINTITLIISHLNQTA